MINGPVFIKTDGSVRENDHPAGPSSSIGYVIEDNNAVIETGFEKISAQQESSCATEYIALEKALQRLYELGYTGYVFVKTDAKNMVDILNGDSTPRSTESRTILERVKYLLKKFEGFNISKTDREFTEQAHQLANRAHRTG